MTINKKVYLGLFLISAATLTFEISLIRFFSIAQWYHFAFMVVSIALFGMAVAGTYLALKKHHNPLFISAILFAISVLVGFYITNQIVFDPFQTLVDARHIFVLLLYYLVLGLPFFFFGIIIAFVFSKFQEKAGLIYCANMSGSAFGAVLALILVSVIQTKVILVISILGLLSALLFIQTYRAKLQVSALAKLGIVFVLILINLNLFLLPLELTISKYKELPQALNVPKSQLLDTRYNSFSRVDVFESSYAKYAPGLSPAFSNTLPEQIGITVDAGNMSAITKLQDNNFINHLPSAIPYSLSDNLKTLIINPGAGLDVLNALDHQADVTAIESNPIIIDLLQNDYSEFSENIYDRARVVFEDGRSYVKSIQDKEQFDIIVLSLTGNVLGGAAGISGLNENYLMTKEAFQEYYNVLNNNGVLVVTRWLSFPPRESLRLFTMAQEIDPTAEKIVMLRSWTTVSLLLFKDNLNPATIEKISNFVENNQFDLIYLPTTFTPNKHLRFDQAYYANAVQNILKDKEKFYQTYLFDVKPVTDNKPFYFHFFKVSKMKELFSMLGERWNPFFDSGFLLLVILIQALILSIVFILLPLIFFSKYKLINTKKATLIYFFAIGLSYLFIELVLIQKFILFIGHINYSSAALIFSLLFFSGLGALASQRLKVKHLRQVMLVLLSMVVIYLLTLDNIISVFLSFSLPIKLFLSVLITAPLGFVMGMPFPLGIRAIRKESITWAWAVNGSASVLSPILAILIALFSGYNFVLLLAGLLYLVGAIFILPRLGQLREQTLPR